MAEGIAQQHAGIATDLDVVVCVAWRDEILSRHVLVKDIEPKRALREMLCSTVPQRH